MKEIINKMIISKYYFSLVVLLVTLILSLIFKEGIYIVLGFIIADIIGLAITRYRMRKGYYGDNECECRELIVEALKYKNIK